MKLTNINDIKAILKASNMWAKKSFGQNFLVNAETVKKIVAAGDVKTTDSVLEIGPGLGVLTNEILKYTKNLLCLEMDPSIIPVLKANIKILHKDLNELNVENIDALKFNPDTKFKANYKIIANIPYFITSPLLRHFLKDQYLKKSSVIPSVIIFLIQKEVAQKIVNKKKESVIGLNIKTFGTPEIIDFVPANYFHPAPKIDSAILKITVHDKPVVNLEKTDLNKYFKLIEAGFSSPRKKLHNNLTKYLQQSGDKTKELIKSAGVDPDTRAEKLSIQDWENLISFL